MKTPYTILGINTDANDHDIKQAYLQQVKNNPPDRDQEKFLQIHNAYLLIKDVKSRVSYDLFTLPSADFTSIVDTALQSEQSLMLDSDTLQSLLGMDIDEACLLNAIRPKN